MQTIIISGLAILGLGTTLLVTLNVNETYTKSVAFLVQYLSGDIHKNIYAASDNENITCNTRTNNANIEQLSIIGNARYLLIPKYVYNLDNNFTSNLEELLENKKTKYLFITDGDLFSKIKSNYYSRPEDTKMILSALNNTYTIATFKKDNVSSYQESLFSLWDKGLIERLGEQQEIEIRVGKIQ
jgi:hypothetical protein